MTTKSKPANQGEGNLTRDSSIQILHSPDLEPLLAELGSRLSTPLSDTFAEEIIVTSSADAANYLKRELPRWLGSTGFDNGIAANISFIYPREIINTQLGKAVGGDNPIWDAVKLTWVIAQTAESNNIKEKIPNFAAAPLAVSRRIADLFDRYASHRPEMLAKWRDGNAYEVRGDNSQDWQVDLYRSVNTAVESLGFGKRAIGDLKAFEKTLGAMVSGGQIPERLSIFGIDTLSRAAREILSSLSTVCAVTVYFVYAPGSKWPRKVDSLTPRSARPQFDITHPLSSRWAAQTIEGAALLPSGHIGHVSAVPRTNSLLHRLQESIISDDGSAIGSLKHDGAFFNGDGSIQIHQCFGLARQAEALRDALLHILNNDHSVRLRDIAIVCPDIETAAPILNAVLSPESNSDQPLPKLQINILHSSAKTSDPLAEAFFAIIDIVSGRCSAAKLLDALSLEPIRQKFGFDADELIVLGTWIDQLAVKFGLNAAHRSFWNVPDSIRTGTWEAAVQRLMVGIAVPAEHEIIGPGNIVPFDGISGSEFETAGKLAEILKRLGLIVETLTGEDGYLCAVSTKAWRDILLSIIDGFLEVAHSDADKLIVLRSTVLNAYRDSEKAYLKDSQLFTIRDLLQLTNEYFESGYPMFWTRHEAITVARISDLQHLPFKVIAVFGADEKAFAGSNSDDDDVLANNPLIGEPLYSLSGRHRLFGFVMSARQNLIITCTGTDVTNNREVPLAIPVKELLEFINHLVIENSDNANAQRILINHPRQNFDKETMRPGLVFSDAPFTFEPEAFVAYETLKRGQETKVTTEKHQNGDKDLATKLTKPIRNLQQMLELIQNPVEFYFEHTLNVRIPEMPSESRETTISGDGVLNLTIDALARASEGRHLLDAIVRSENESENAITDWIEVHPHAGTLPPKQLGKLILTEIGTELKNMIMMLPAHLQSLNGNDEDCVLTFNNESVTLRITGVVDANMDKDSTPTSIVRIRYKRYVESLVLEMWVEVAILTIARNGQRVVGHLVSRSEKADDKAGGTHEVVELTGGTDEDRLARAHEVLVAVEGLHSAASAGVIPFFERASRKIADGNEKQAVNKFDQDIERSSAIRYAFGDQEFDDIQALLATDSDFEHLSLPNDKRKRAELFAHHVWGLFDKTVHTPANMHDLENDEEAGESE